MCRPAHVLRPWFLSGIPLVIIWCGLAPLCRGENATELPPAPAANQPPDVFLGDGVRDEYASVREAIAAAKQHSGRDYRVIVVKNATGAATLLRRLVERWRAEAG